MTGKIDKISRKVYVHSPINPPTVGQGLDAKITLLNSKLLKISDWEEGDHPSFTLTIKDPGKLGLKNSEDLTVEQFVDDVILLCNLVLKHAAFSRYQSNSTHSIVEKAKDDSSHITSEETPDGKRIIINEVMNLSTRIHITMGFEDELDENTIIQLLSKIQNLKSGNTITNLQTTDLKKSLEEFSAGMSSFKRLGIFKHLFSSLELSTNCDGTDRKSSDLDNEVVRITNIDYAKIEDYRQFNGRAKHIDRNSQEEQKYQEGLQKLGEKIEYLKEAAKTMIRTRLMSLN